jgi:hypothetical protein
MGGEHLSPEAMRFARRAFRKGWRVVTILAAISMMRVQPALPHRATLYRILGKDGREAPKKRGAPKKYFSKKRGDRMVEFLNKETKKSSFGIEITAQYLKTKLRFTCGLSTIRNELHKRGYQWLRPKRFFDLTREDRKERLAFAKEHVNKSPEQLKRFFGLTLDEKTFSSSDSLHYARHAVRGLWMKKRGDPRQTRPGDKHTPSRAANKKVGVCGGIIGDIIQLWYNYKGKMNSSKFCSPKIIKTMKANKVRKMTCDNARFHTSKMSKKWLSSNKIRLSKFPRRSPDLMPLDFAIWSRIIQKMAQGDLRRKYKAETQSQFSLRLRRTAKKLPHEFFRKVWVELKDRLKRVIANRGGAISDNRLVKV